MRQCLRGNDNAGSGKALPALIDQAVVAGGVEINGVAGATTASKAFTEAIADAVSQA